MKTYGWVVVAGIVLTVGASMGAWALSGSAAAESVPAATKSDMARAKATADGATMASSSASSVRIAAERVAAPSLTSTTVEASASPLELDDQHRRRQQRLARELLPPIDELLGDPILGTRATNLGAEEQEAYARQITELNRERSFLDGRFREVSNQCVSDKVDRGVFDQLNGNSVVVGGRHALLNVTRHRRDEPSIQVRVFPGEYPELDALADARRSVNERAHSMLQELFEGPAR